MKTAVEWLYDQIENEGKCIYEVIEQAKEMEKEQIINAWNSAAGGDAFSSAGQYYISNFKSE
jgi:3-dehydroquinate dehydratase